MGRKWGADHRVRADVVRPEPGLSGESVADQVRICPIAAHVGIWQEFDFLFERCKKKR
jgi:hypothetical protein